MPLILLTVEIKMMALTHYVVMLVFSGYHMYVFIVIVLVSGADLLAQQDIWIIEL